MSKKFAALAAAGAILLSAAVVIAGPKFKKASRGVLENGELTAYASCWTGATEFCQPVKKYSGRMWTAEGEIEGIGTATVEVRASWDWGRSLPAGGIYTSDHRGALLVTTSQGFEDSNGDTITIGAWTADATVTVTDSDTDSIFGNIVGGSVYELFVHPSPDSGSINEWLISFDIVGGDGKFVGAGGTGVYRMVWDSSTDLYGGAPRDLTDPTRFLEQEIFLHLDK